MRFFHLKTLCIVGSCIVLSVLSRPSVYAGGPSFDVSQVIVSVQVVDEDGYPLPGIMVTAVNKDTGVRLTAVTDFEGKINVRRVSAGTYRLTFEMAGFQTRVIDNIIVSERNIAMKINMASGDIDITGGIGGAPPPGIEEGQLLEGQNFNPFDEGKVGSTDNVFYFEDGKFYAENGIARIGHVEKKISDITEIPFEDDKYKKEGIEIEEDCIYIVRVGKNSEERLFLIKVLHVENDTLKIEFYRVKKDEN